MAETQESLSQPAKSLTKASTTPSPLDDAFVALARYDSGASRGALKPIDDAVLEAVNLPDSRQPLEDRLVGVLEQRPSVSATAYICHQLKLIGSETCVSVLAECLQNPEQSQSARDVLEVLPTTEADRVLRQALGVLEGVEQVGVIHSLGARRDPGSVPLLVALIPESEAAVVAASLRALGRIGTTEAAQTLADFQAKPPGGLGTRVEEAALVCAEQLLADGHPGPADALYRSVAGSAGSERIRRAAHRGLAPR